MKSSVAAIILGFAMPAMGEVLEIGPKVVTPTSILLIDSDKAKMIELDHLGTSGKNQVRLFFQLRDEKPDGKIPKGSAVEIFVYHNHPGGSSNYFSKVLSAGDDDEITAFIEVPVYGDSMRILVFNKSLPTNNYEYVLTAKTL